MKKQGNRFQIIVEQDKNAKTGGSIVGLNLAEELGKKINLNIFALDHERRSFKILGERILNPFKVSSILKNLANNEVVLFNYYFDLAALNLLILSFFKGNKNIVAFHTFFKKGNFFVDSIYLIKKIILLNSSLFFSKKLIFLTRSQQSYFRKFAIIKKLFDIKSVTINNGINFNQVLPRKSKKSGLNLIYVGRLVNQKGAKEILQLADTPNLFSKMIVIGKGNPNYQKILENNNLIEYHKSIEYSKMSYFYDRSNILVLPSYSEVFPLVILEAMARGLVIVVSDIPGMREIIIPGRNGFLFEKGNINSLKKILKNLKDNPLLIREISQNNLKDVLKFSTNRQVAEYYRVYKEVKN